MTHYWEMSYSHRNNCFLQVTSLSPTKLIIISWLLPVKIYLQFLILYSLKCNILKWNLSEWYFNCKCHKSDWKINRSVCITTSVVREISLFCTVSVSFRRLWIINLFRLKSVKDRPLFTFKLSNSPVCDFVSRLLAIMYL